MEKPEILCAVHAAWCAANGDAGFLLAGGGTYIAGTFAAAVCLIPALAAIKLGGAAA